MAFTQEYATKHIFVTPYVQQATLLPIGWRKNHWIASEIKGKKAHNKSLAFYTSSTLTIMHRHTSHF